jgi:hypothetical protein
MEWTLVLLVARLISSGDPWVEQRVGFASEDACRDSLGSMVTQLDSRLVAFCAPTAGLRITAPVCPVCLPQRECPSVGFTADLNGDGIECGGPDLGIWTTLCNQAKGIQ